ncbi:Hydroxyacid-oxoacid transhydrogenase, mitochondrial [Acipenser ruthenus]|uniref:Hydroxyacid-oxoacid transhydrogenase, mitochondrial n=1 Tax=Acipenser ruthenus TaxID=7906 RepID=A0A444TW56_ACIRT|nr:Hydroxyacid-oxoacid transhydrogenase, mitochondrial [Acipenser ruthenus]
MTDKNLARLPPVKAVFNSLAKHGVNFKFYDKVRVEPTDTSFKEAIDFAKRGQFDAYVAVGGGSVIDTCKAANLYACNPKADFLDYVNAPIGKGKPRVAANSGFDVLCHALESYTALPYNMRSPCPPNPIYRPAYQGSNPISDVWSKHALNIVAKYMKRRQCLKTQKNVKGDLALDLGPEATLPLTGGVSQNSPSILRKILMKNKKRREYLGATNSTFEPD